jgi:hypothetical protein
MKRGERDVGSGSVLAGAFKGDRCVGHDDPDATTLLKLRRLLEKHKLTASIFETINC